MYPFAFSFRPSIETQRAGGESYSLKAGNRVSCFKNNLLMSEFRLYWTSDICSLLKETQLLVLF